MLTLEQYREPQTALDFYGPIFLLYSIYDGAEDKSQVIKLLEEHMDHFLQEMQISWKGEAIWTMNQSIRNGFFAQNVEIKQDWN